MMDVFLNQCPLMINLRKGKKNQGYGGERHRGEKRREERKELGKRLWG